MVQRPQAADLEETKNLFDDRTNVTAKTHHRDLPFYTNYRGEV
jgi:hypothetical protein